MKRDTLQRKLLLNELHSEGHLRKSEIIRIFNEKYPSISIATVYRNLLFLEEEGMIRRLSSSTNEEIYEDSLKDQHDHFICLDCGKILDIDNSTNIKSYYDNDDNLVVYKTTTYYGICSECLSMKKS